MNLNQSNNFDDLFDQVLDYYLGAFSPQEERRMEDQIRSDPQTESVLRHIHSMLDPLKDYEVPIPAGLEQKIFSSVKTSKPSVEEILQDFTVAGSSRRRIIFKRFADFAATAAAVLLISSAILLSTGHVRQQSRKMFCAENLGMLGSALASYSSDYPQQLPYAKIASNGAWYDGQNNQPRRMHLFILVKGNYARPQFLICPEEKSNPKPILVKDMPKLNDFPENMIVSYSFQNLNGDQKFSPALRQIRWLRAQNMAIMADRTPLLTQDRLNPVLKSGPVFSTTHGRLRGQNILSLDGRVTWQQTPLFGPRQDNIWQAGNIQRYYGKEIPADSLDSFLAP
ncbi:MAG: hypothetical protein WC975_13585 [Phycisphaerae bacterium]